MAVACASHAANGNASKSKSPSPSLPTQRLN
jgi:hypothetical protein